MKKTINIMGKDYEVCINAYTPFLYKKTFKSGFMEDLSKLSEISIKKDELEKELKKKNLTDEELEQQLNVQTMGSLDDLLGIITQIAYIMILGNNKNFKSYEEWLQEQENFDISGAWIGEVTEFAVTSFR